MYTYDEMQLANKPFVRYSGKDRCEWCCFEEPGCWKYKCSDDDGQFYYVEWPAPVEPSWITRLIKILSPED